MERLGLMIWWKEGRVAVIEVRGNEAGDEASFPVGALMVVRPVFA